KENLCLYGLPNETWEVNLPVEEVPPELPEPALGINFARDGMQEKDWLSLVAVHSDSWLLAVAFYFGARFSFGKNESLDLEREYQSGLWKPKMLDESVIGTSESPNGEILEGAQNLFNLLEDSLVGEFHFGEEENSFHDAGLANCAIQEDYLDWEASLENYFELKPIVEARKLLFVKLKLKGTAFQWWKRVEEQHACVTICA
ncbi:hypothetical protein Golax_010309, partial [Gossypium laxum]|nr:hypothetical protein [Gossypium laxum]